MALRPVIGAQPHSVLSRPSHHHNDLTQSPQRCHKHTICRPQGLVFCGGPCGDQLRTSSLNTVSCTQWSDRKEPCRAPSHGPPGAKQKLCVANNLSNNCKLPLHTLSPWVCPLVKCIWRVQSGSCCELRVNKPPAEQQEFVFEFRVFSLKKKTAFEGQQHEP